MDANLAVDLGPYVASVVPNGAAADGIENGDVILQNDNTPVTDAQSLDEALATHNPGDAVGVYVYRGNQYMTITVTLGELQAGSEIRFAGISQTTSSGEAGWKMEGLFILLVPACMLG